MKFTGQEAKDLATEVRGRSTLLRTRLGDKQLSALLNACIAEVGTTLRGIETRLTEAGSMPGDIAGVLLLYGAVVAIFEDMPQTEDRRQLVEAGAAIGRLMAKKYGEKVDEHLTKTQGGN